MSGWGKKTMTDLDIKIERSYYSGMPIARLSLQGTLDSLTKPQLEQAIENLLSEYTYRFILDLSSGLETTGSTGLGTFIKIAGKVKEKGGGLVVIKPTERLKTAFDLVGLWSYISVADDLEGALKLFLPGNERG